MNIAQAKEQVRKTCIAYLTKDDYGNYLVPVETQRPVFLVGAPGIGKTAIMSQVADELGISLVDYSMTHHTRQSAIGLPFIAHREYGGREFDISEYTMSEIIASVYETIELTGKPEGILFLDEVNCVSETLEPAMLRFLQSKVFGNHRVPDGWIIVSAGNPMEFNRNAHQFDIVTLDRVKRMEVEPDFSAWRDYATAQGAHPAVLSYLELKPDNFYRMETQGRDRNFVTARAWMDLSNMMRLYERNELEIDEDLVGQYVQIPRVAKDFFAYLELFAAYQRDYDVPGILAGRATDAARERAAAAGYDEQMALTGLLSDAVAARTGAVMAEKQTLEVLRRELTAMKAAGCATSDDCAAYLDAAAERLRADLQDNALHYRQNPLAREAQSAAVEVLQDFAAKAGAAGDEPLPVIGSLFNSLLAAHNSTVEAAKQEMDCAIAFVADATGESNALIILLSELSMNASVSRFLGAYGCDSYFEHSKVLMLEQREGELSERLAKLEQRLGAAV